MSDQVSDAVRGLAEQQTNAMGLIKGTDTSNTNVINTSVMSPEWNWRLMSSDLRSTVS